MSNPNDMSENAEISMNEEEHPDNLELGEEESSYMTDMLNNLFTQYLNTNINAELYQPINSSENSDSTSPPSSSPPSPPDSPPESPIPDLIEQNIDDDIDSLPPFPPPPPPRPSLIQSSMLPSSTRNIVYLPPSVGGQVAQGASHVLFTPIPFGSLIQNTFPVGGSGAPAPGTMASIIQNSFENDKDKYKHVISDEGKELLKPKKYSEIETDEKKCSIMHEEFEPDTMVIQLPCKHVFCEEAINHWIENESASCPVCRDKLPSKEIENKDEIERRARARNVPISRSAYYQRLFQNIEELQTRREEEDIQRAIWNSLN